MSSIKSFFEETFFISGAEGTILFAMCIVAVVLTLAAIALVITVIVTVRRRKREYTAEVTETLQEETSVEVFAETSEQAPVEMAAVFTEDGVRYNKSFTAKLIQSDDKVKSWYAALKNELLSYKKVKARMSWKRENYHFGRKNIVCFSFRGKTLCVYFALNPNEFEESKYKVEASDYAVYADTPCMYRIKNERRVRYAKDLITMVMKIADAERNDGYVSEDYNLPYEDTEALIEKRLIKVVNITPNQIISQDSAEEVVEEEAEEEQADEEEAVSEEVPEEEPIVETAEEDAEVE